jgi:hypothetical protein
MNNDTHPLLDHLRAKDPFKNTRTGALIHALLEKGAAPDRIEKALLEAANTSRSVDEVLAATYALMDKEADAARAIRPGFYTIESARVDKIMMGPRHHKWERPAGTKRKLGIGNVKKRKK